jgi:hypothetical protein
VTLLRIEEEATTEVRAIMDGLTQDPVRGMKVTMLLADYAVASEGKLTVVGGGWNLTNCQVPWAIGLLFDVPWHMTNEKHKFRLELIDVDGNSVLPIGADEPVVIEGEFELGRPPGAPMGATFPFPVALNSGPMPLPSGSQVEWRLLVNEQTHEDWRLPFYTQPGAQSQAA